MTSQDFVYMLGDFANFSAIPGLILFIAVYARGRWREFVAGRSLMYFALALAFTVLSGLLVILFGTDYFGREWVRLILFAGISASIWRLAFVVIQIQNKPPRTAAELAAALDALLLEEKKHPHRTGRTSEIPVVKPDDTERERY